MQLIKTIKICWKYLEIVFVHQIKQLKIENGANNLSYGGIGKSFFFQIIWCEAAINASKEEESMNGHSYYKCRENLSPNLLGKNLIEMELCGMWISVCSMF